MLTPHNPKQFNTEQADWISDIITKLTGLFEWKEVEGTESELVDYWSQIPENTINLLKSELQATCELVGGDPQQFKMYAYYLKNSVTSPANNLLKKVEKWASDNPKKGNGAALALIIGSMYFKQPLTPIRPIEPEPDTNAQLREVLQEVRDFLAAVVQCVIDVTRPYFDRINVIAVPRNERPATHNKEVINKITIKAGVINDLYEILRIFFSEDQQEALKMRLQGNVDRTGKLLFMDDGNKLAHAFKQLQEAYLIPDIKADLENWIRCNFQYRGPKSRGEIKDFTAAYLNSIISSNKGCISPILEITKGVDGGYKLAQTMRTKKISTSYSKDIL